jgi:hypothetical protein
MSAAVESAAAQIVSLRARVGQGTSTEIFSDAEASTCLDAAHRELNRMLPVEELKSFLTVALQQAYTETEAGVDADAFRPIKKVFWKGTAACSCDGLGDSYAVVLDALLAGTYPLRVDYAAYEMMARNYSIIQRYIGGRGKQMEDGKIWLDPIPSAAVRVYYFERRPRFSTRAEVNQQFYELFMDYAEFKACQLLAAKQSEFASVKGGAFGKTIGTAGGRIYQEMALDARRRFYSAASKAPRLYYV